VPDHRRLGPPDEEHEERRYDERDRVEEDRDRRGDDPDEVAGDARPSDLRGRLADLELRVALDELVALDDRRQVALVGDIEEHRQRSRDEGHDIELPDRQGAEQVGDRDRDEGEGPAQVARDHDRAAAEAIDPRPGRQREQDERQELDRAEQREREWLDLEDERRGERDRERADLRAEDADRLGRPDLLEVGVADETRAGRSGGGGIRARRGRGHSE